MTNHTHGAGDPYDAPLARLSGAPRKPPGGPRRGSPPPPRRRRRRPRVESQLLRVPVPYPGDLEEALQARASVAAAAAAAAPTIGGGGAAAGRARAAGGAAAAAAGGDGGRERKCRSMENSWNALLMRVWKRHGSALIKELGPRTIFEPFDLDMGVKRSFLQECQERPHGLTVSYHGTQSRNLPSIASRGLLVPGKSSGIPVANGSREGPGVYTARLGAAWLSRGFSDGKGLLVCVVCDTSRGTTNEAAEDWRPSAASVQADFPQQQPPSQVLHSRDAVVVFESRLVAPLFLADSVGQEAAEEEPRGEWRHHEFLLRPEADWAPPQQIGRRSIVEPKAGDTWVKFGGKDKEGHRVWLTPMPLEKVTRQQRRLKRRQQCISWQKARRAERHRLSFWPESKWDLF